MIIDTQKFISTERPAWTELEGILTRIEAEPNVRLKIEEIQRFFELYQRASAGLVKLSSSSSELQTRRYLEGLVARAYGEIHETREKRRRVYPLKWFFQTLPQTFRRHIYVFYLSLIVTIGGTAFGALATTIDPDSRRVTMPFGHDRMRPSERVQQEESGARAADLSGNRTTFSAYLMTHNIRVSVFTLALGMTYGIGSIAALFYNGVVLGAVATDYVTDGQTKFLLGWLMPHGVIEIPAILIAGQAGLLLALGLIGWGRPIPLGDRLREVSRDAVTLSFGFALMLVWAGFIEAFLSQYHEPFVPYEAKIAFGAIELVLFYLYLSRSGR